MCGIAGLVCLEEGHCEAEHETRVAEMCELQRHRGPDDGGVVSIDGVCLGSRRLSILDLSAAGHMPMSDPGGRWWITYNGEVYNFRELRTELAEAGHHFESQTDTEVVLHSYMEWGACAIDRFVGMFAFAVYDRSTKTLTLARDRVGIKPLYYMQDGTHTLFASEIKAFIGGWNRPGINEGRLTEWFLYRNVDALQPESLVDGISSVLPGELITIDGAGRHVRQAYRVSSHVSKRKYDRYASARPRSVIDEIDAALDEATHARLVSDVPVGTLLSGGLDSSLITALAAKHTRDLTAFNVSIADFPDLDERRHAETLAQDLGLELVSHTLTAQSFRRALPHVIHASDLPLSHPNTVAYSLISRVAREHGVVVLLSGEGADELFGGYAWNYKRRRMLRRIEPLLEKVPRRILELMTLLSYASAGLPVANRRFRELLPPAVAHIDRYARATLLRDCEEAYSFVPRNTDRVVLGAMLADLNDFLAPLLRRLDRTTMAASVECRVPFLDHRVIHKVINLPLRYRIRAREDKWVLRQVAARYLPGSLAGRKKKGFPLPLRDYLAPFADPRFFEEGYLQESLGLTRAVISDALDSWTRSALGFFGLVTLEIWGRLFFRGDSVAQISAQISALEPRPRNGDV